MAMHPIMKQILKDVAPKPATLAGDELDIIEAIARNGQTGRLTAYEVRELVRVYRASQAQHEALRGLLQIVRDMRADEEFDATTNDAGGILFGDIAEDAIRSAETSIALVDEAQSKAAGK